MNLIDTNAVTYIFQQNIQCNEIYYMAPEVTEEVDMARLIFSKGLPKELINISKYIFFDENLYIDFYQQMLNKHHGRSFFNMTGFGDISILATIHTAFKVFEEKKQQCMFDLPETITVYTNDNGLKNRVGIEFSANKISCKGIEEIQ